MLKMVNKICESIDINLDNANERKRLIKKYADKEIYLDVAAIKLFVKFN